MHRLIRRTYAFVRGHRWLVLGIWALALAAALPLAARQSDHLSGGGFTVPGSGSLAVDKELRKDFPRFERSPLIAVLAPEPGATPREVLQARTRLLHAVRAEPHVRVASPRQAGAPLSVRRPSLIPLRTARGDDQNIDTARQLRQRLGIADQSGPVHLHLVGYGALWSGLNVTSKKDLASAEKIGFPIVAAILLAVFGSLAAGALPLSLRVVAGGITGAMIYLLSLAMNMSIFVTNMASMVGIGVAVDYSLFVLARFREEVWEGGSREAALERAMSTSGVAVLFSGVTVMASLAGLYLVPNNAIRSMALGAILVVAVSLLASAALLPALIARFGERVIRPGRIQRFTSRFGPRGPAGDFWR